MHNIDHIRRVWNTSKLLCEKLDCDLEIMAAAVFLHDLGRHYGLEIHGAKMSNLQSPYLKKHIFDADKLDALGRISVLRDIQHYYMKGSPIDMTLAMIEKRWNGISLPESREMFIGRYEYTKDFFTELKKGIEV